MNAKERLEQFEREDRQQRRLLWLGAAVAVLATLGALAGAI